MKTGPLAQCTMRPNVIILLSPLFYKYLGFKQCCEYLPIQYSCAHIRRRTDPEQEARRAVQSLLMNTAAYAQYSLRL